MLKKNLVEKNLDFLWTQKIIMATTKKLEVILKKVQELTNLYFLYKTLTEYYFQTFVILKRYLTTLSELNNFHFRGLYCRNQRIAHGFSF